MRGLLYQLTRSLVLTLLVGLSATATQQPAARQKAPRLTTDDVVRTPVTEPAGDSKEAVTKPESATKSDVAESKSEQAKAATEVKVSAEETSWRERVAKARSRAKELERAAEEAELRITQLRNELGTSGQSARYRNDTVAELGQAGQRLSEVTAQARVAADDAAQLAEYGRQKGFTEAEGPKATSEEGKPNEEYYRSQFLKLTEALEGAQRRVALYDNRIRDLNQQIATNSGGKDKSGRATGGDSFFAMQLQKDREDAQQKLDEARTAQTKAQNDLYALREEARRAGVPPGLFR
jgi:chromosome segregation ATPase